MRSLLTLCLLGCSLSVYAQSPANDSPNSVAEQNAVLQYVVYLSRHGVRSPTAKPAQYSRYAAAPWPQWDVPPGYLTAHGYKLMTFFGGYDRALLVNEGLFAPSGCADAARVTILADSDQRTRETGKALAQGLLPGCSVEVQTRPEGTNDPLFHFHEAGVGRIDSKLAAAAIGGRIGGRAGNLTEAYRPQLAALDRVLAGCVAAPGASQKRTSLFDLPADLTPGAGGHPAELRGPLGTASSLSESLMLEYAEGMSGARLGWGCLDKTTLHEVMQLHTAATEFSQRTPAIARFYASNLLDNILRAMKQSATSKSVVGAPGKVSDRALFLVGHDTNISAVAGALGLGWIIDGRRDDTPPGGALVFELWKQNTTGAYSVRTFYTAQTLDQMRNSTPLSLSNPPERVPVFLPGCSRADSSCDWQSFENALRAVIDPSFVK